jgi:hypothetical protein
MPNPLRQRIRVTGGAGFLGAHLCQRLLAQGHDVICVDNFFTGTKGHILELLDHPHFELIRHDVTFPLDVEVDQIDNLACPASPIHDQHDPVQTTKTSVHGAINLLGRPWDQAQARTQARILQASTSEVYGDPERHPQTEDDWGHVNGPRAHRRARRWSTSRSRPPTPASASPTSAAPARTSAGRPPPRWPRASSPPSPASSTCCAGFPPDPPAAHRAQLEPGSGRIYNFINVETLIGEAPIEAAFGTMG